ncbi:MAG: 3-dehydroquinate synthase [Bacteroidota bacterium]
MTNNSSSDYTILIGDEVFSEISNFISGERYVNNSIFILVDENTNNFCHPLLIDNIEKLRKAEIIEIKSGEENKSIEVCSQIWQRLGDSGADRRSLLINLGGGVIGDMGGFIASTYKRGIDFINVPTTLLSQVDASIGGKVGINLNNLKNQVGVFNNPKAVFVYPGFLKTLNKRHLLSGFAEVVKHGLITDYSFWNEIKRDFLNLQDLGNLGSAIWENIIIRSIQIKNNIVLKDPWEQGLRKVLNFGHTIGHALESDSLENDKIPLLHGEAVAIGMICESYLSCKVSGLSQVELEEITSFILSVFDQHQIEINTDKELIELMKQDKKNEIEKINFTLLSKSGKAVINQNCNDELICEALGFYRQKII